MGSKRLLFILLAFTIVSCQIVPVVKIINHDKPDLRVDAQPFKEANCTSTGSDQYECKEGSELFDLGCTYVGVDPLLGGLQPDYPVATCSFYISPSGQDADCLFTSGGMLRACRRLVIVKEGGFQVVESYQELLSIYAPITSPEEALSLVLAGRKVTAYFGQERKSNYAYSVGRIEDTHVDTVEAGYVVHVFDYSLFGCGPHETYAVEIQVSQDGNMEEINRYSIYRDPSEDGLCVD